MKNPKLEAAQRRLFNGRTVLPDNPWPRESKPGPYSGCTFENGSFKGVVVDSGPLTFELDSAYQPPAARLQAEVNALQELLNEKDELLDKLQRPMVIRMDWWLVGLVVTVLIAHGLGQI